MFGVGWDGLLLQGQIKLCQQLPSSQWLLYILLQSCLERGPQGFVFEIFGGGIMCDKRGQHSTSMPLPKHHAPCLISQFSYLNVQYGECCHRARAIFKHH
jgi:hypothetical protein